MRIIHVVKHCRDGNGNVHVAVDLACEQARNGHDVVFASGGGYFELLLAAHGVRHVHVSNDGRLSVGTSVRDVVRIARSFQPDVIHAHMMTSAVLGFVASKIVGAPLVTTVHNSFDRHSVLMRLGTVVVAVSEADRALLLSRGYPADRVVTVLNGANGSARESADAEPALDIAQPCLLTLSGLHKRKAVGDVIDAFAQIAADFPQWHLNIVGDGPDREVLENAVADASLAQSIHFIGSRLAPRSLLDQADIFVSASLAEPFGLAVAEARASGCAIVATAVGGVPEVLDHGNAGLLTPAADTGQMASRLRELMSDQCALTAWRAKAKVGAERFTVQRMTRDYLRLYDSLSYARCRSARLEGPRNVDRGAPA